MWITVLTYKIWRLYFKLVSVLQFLCVKNLQLIFLNFKQDWYFFKEPQNMEEKLKILYKVEFESPQKQDLFQTL